MRRVRFVVAAGVLSLCASGSPAPAAPPAAKPAKGKFVPAGTGMERTIATDVPDTVPHTLADALSVAYETNPQLTGERAHLRATDESVPTALAGWRPTISVTGNYGDASRAFR